MKLQYTLSPTLHLPFLVLQARRRGLRVLVANDGVAVAVDEGCVDIRRRALDSRPRRALHRRRALGCVQSGHLDPHARHEARPRGALARELRRVLGDVHAQREDLGVG